MVRQNGSLPEDGQRGPEQYRHPHGYLNINLTANIPQNGVSQPKTTFSGIAILITEQLVEVCHSNRRLPGNNT